MNVTLREEVLSKHFLSPNLFYVQCHLCFKGFQGKVQRKTITKKKLLKHLQYNEQTLEIFP